MRYLAATSLTCVVVFGLFGIIHAIKGDNTASVINVGLAGWSAFMYELWRHKGD